MGVGNAATADTIAGASAGPNSHGIMGPIYLAVSSKEFHPREAHEIGTRPHLPQPGKVAKRKRFTNPGIDCAMTSTEPNLIRIRTPMTFKALRH